VGLRRQRTDLAVVLILAPAAAAAAGDGIDRAAAPETVYELSAGIVPGLGAAQTRVLAPGRALGLALVSALVRLGGTERSSRPVALLSPATQITPLGRRDVWPLWRRVR
jgi:hypothetical protein